MPTVMFLLCRLCRQLDRRRGMTVAENTLVDNFRAFLVQMGANQEDLS